MQHPQQQPRSLRDYLRLVFTGVAMGIADLIPGVSGGTMAFILGIYDELLNAIKSFNLKLGQLVLQLKFREAFAQIPFGFLIPLAIGLLGAVFSMATLMEYLLLNQPVYLFAFFFGLIVASIIAVGATLTWERKTIIALIVGSIGAYIIVGLVPLDMPHDPLTLFLSGAVAIMAMILPGISGSFILLILGQYAHVLNAVTEFDLLTIAPVAAGAALGLLGFARVLSWLLHHHHAITVAVLVGFMVGSLRKIWPWKEVLATTLDRHGEVIPISERNILPNGGTAEALIALGLAVVGFILLCFIDHLQGQNNPIFRWILPNQKPAPATQEATS